jgi:hypothetical protein
MVRVSFVCLLLMTLLGTSSCTSRPSDGEITTAIIEYDKQHRVQDQSVKITLVKKYNTSEGKKWTVYAYVVYDYTTTWHEPAHAEAEREYRVGRSQDGKYYAVQVWPKDEIREDID